MITFCSFSKKTGNTGNRFFHSFWLCITIMIVTMMATILLPQQYSYAGQATLTWNAPTTNIDGTPITYFSGDYRIYYGTATGNYSQLTNLNNSNSVVTKEISNLTDGQSYYFVVTAINTMGNESGYSNEVTKTALSVTPTTYTITASAGTNGTISPAGTTTVSSGAGQAYTITPNTGYHVASVLVDGSPVGKVTSYTLSNVTANHTISATFAIDTFSGQVTLTWNAPTTNIDGTPITDFSGDYKIYYGTATGNYSQLTNLNNSNSVVTKEISNLTDGQSYYFVVTALNTQGIESDYSNEVSKTAQSVNPTTYAITASAGTNGTISPAGTTTVSSGAGQAYTITPNTGYHVASVLVDGSPVGTVTSYTFSNVTANHTISATFAINTYTITASSGTNGTVTPAGTTTVSSGVGQVYTITPSTGYHVASVLVDGSPVGTVTSYTFSNVTANHTISATFAINTYTITASSGTNGTVTPAGTTTVSSGVGQVYTITPSTGYHVASVLVDGSPVGTVTSYTFSNVTANHTISATFENDTYTAITSANNATFIVGFSGTFTVTTSGYPSPALSETGTLPTGVTFNASTGVLSGTPAAGTGGVYNITFTAANGVAPNATQDFTLTVKQAPAIISANSATFNVGTAGTFTVTATGYLSPTLNITGSLPAGVTFNAATGVLSGTPKAGTVGSYNLTIFATNGVTPNASQSFTLTVKKTGTSTTISGNTRHPHVKGDTYNVTFAVSSDGGSPTGSVTVSDGTDSCSAPVSAGSCQLTSTTAGLKTIKATYSGDSNFKGSTSSGIAVRVLNLFTTVAKGAGIDGGTIKSNSKINATWDGSVTDGTNIEQLPEGTGPYAITATAKAGEKVKWMGDCDITGGNNSSVATCSINSITENKSVQAVFMHKVPSAPSALAANALKEKKVSLTWSDNSGDEYGFRIERKADGGAYKLINTVDVDVKTFTDTGLVPGKTYIYRVSAYNDGGDSAYSGEAVAALIIPNAPTVLRTRAIAPAKIVIAWTDNSSIEHGFKLQRSTGLCSQKAAWVDVPGALGADVTEHIDSGLDPKTAYSYRIKAYNTYGESGYSNCFASTTGEAGTPHSPTELEAASSDGSSIELTWQDNSYNETSFRIYRRVDRGDWALLFTTGAAVTNYTDTSAVNNDSTAKYSYYLTACNVAGCSPASTRARVPKPPSSLIAAPQVTDGIRLDWTPADAAKTGQVIYRKTGDCSSADAWFEIAELAEGADSYKDISVTGESVYSYVIMTSTKSFFHPLAYGYSEQSNCSSAIAP